MPKTFTIFAKRVEMKLPIYKATSFNDIILKGGHSKPWVVSVNTKKGLKPFVVKLYRTIDITARNKMTAEIFGCLLAKEFDLPTPEPAIIEFSEEFRMTLSKKSEEILNLLDERAKFGTEYYEGSFLFAPQIPIDEANNIIPTDTLYAFDYFICNRDRTQNKPNLLIKEGQGILIDHEMALEINQQTFSNLNEGKWDNRYQYHLFHSALKNNTSTEKKDYFNEFEFYLQSLSINKYDEIFQQLKDLGFTDLKEDLIKEYFTLVIRNPRKFIAILKDSIK